MNDIESRIRDTFRGHEGDAPAFDLADARQIAGRTRRRQILNAAGAGLGALAVVVALTAGLGDLVRADQDPTPLDTPSPSPSLELATFSSALHEVTIGYPAGWKVRPATEPWSGGRLAFDASDVDVIFDPTLGAISTSPWSRSPSAECRRRTGSTTRGARGSAPRRRERLQVGSCSTARGGTGP